MSEKNNIFENDLLMRAILKGGQEEVPARVWNAVSERLEKVESARPGNTITLWWRRAGIAVAAAAAVEVTGFEAVVSQTSGARLLAYAPQATSDIVTEHMTAEAEETVSSERENVVVSIAEVSTESDTEAKSEDKDVIATVVEKDLVVEKNEETWHYTDWEEETPERKVKTSVTVSGITGAAGSENGSGNGILKAPSVILTPTKTGIKEKENQTTYNLPVSVGAGVKFDFTPRWSLGVGLNYTCLSRTLNGTYTHVAEDGSIDNLITSDIRNSQHYLGIPVNAYYNIVNNDFINFYTYAGGTVEKCVYDKYLILTGNIVHKEPAKGVQLSANIGVGAEFMLGDHLGLYLDPSLRYYFDCDQPKSIRTAQPLTFGVEVGLRFKL